MLVVVCSLCLPRTAIQYPTAKVMSFRSITSRQWYVGRPAATTLSNNRFEGWGKEDWRRPRGGFGNKAEMYMGGRRRGNYIPGWLLLVSVLRSRWALPTAKSTHRSHRCLGGGVYGTEQGALMKGGRTKADWVRLGRLKRSSTTTIRRQKIRS